MASDESQKVTSALAEAQSIIEAAERRANELRAQGEKAYQEGFERGEREGLEAAQRDAAQHAVRMLEDVSAISDALSEQAAVLGLAIAEKILDTHLEEKPEAIVSITARALEDSLIGSGATIFAHPDDIKILSQAKELIDESAGGVSVSLIGRDDMERGGCLVKTGFGEVDTRIKTLVEVIGHRLGIGNKK